MAKKTWMVVVAMTCASLIGLQAADAPTTKKQLTPEQKQARKEMVQKYDENKDGKLNADEIAKISKEDREKYEKAGVLGKALRKGQKKTQ